MAVIEVQDLRKVYGGRAVVDGVSFDVEEGEIFGILGPNGAGKTTTVECIAGLRRPDGGSVEVLGLDPQRDGPELRRVLGAQLQASQLQQRIRVQEALELYSSFHADPVDREELLELLGLVDQRTTAFGKLSGGQKQRLSIALALVGRPKVAVLDELTTGLDPQARRDTWTLIERVRDSGVTILLVTHFMEEAQRLCDRLAIIDHGRVVALDRPGAVVAQGTDQQRLRFTPSAPVSERALLEVPEVTDVTLDGDRVAVAGRGDLVHAVVVAMDRRGIVARDVDVERHTLDDAFVRLTGPAAERHRLGPVDEEVAR